MTYLHYFILLAVLLEQSVAHDQLVMPVVNIPRYGACPEVEEHKNILQQVRSNINKNLRQSLGIVELPECGGGLWYQVAYLNMTDPSQQCPSAWREYTGVRACGRPVSSVGSCPTTLYPTNGQYSRVCGRVIGYQVLTPDGFRNYDHTGYLDGVSITHGESHHHIWSYVAGASENSFHHAYSNCPCASNARGSRPPLDIGDDYYCESGNPTNSFDVHFYNDPLWDGQQCEGTCCSGPMVQCRAVHPHN